MRALVCQAFGPPENLRILDWPDPEMGPEDVLVEVRAAGVNFPDLLSIAGQYQLKQPPPFIPGCEAAGVITAVGNAVTDFAPGQRVIINSHIGAFAEKCALNATLCQALPDHMSFEQGAGFTITYATSLHAFRQCAPLSPGQTVLVLGAAGGVGTTATELAKAMGCHVIAAASTDEKLAYTRTLGADDTINYTSENLRDRIREITGGKGVDVVYDPVGGTLAEQALRGLAWHGRYLVVGFASGTIPAFAANIALLKEASIIGVWWGTWSARNPAESAENMRQLAEMARTGSIRPRVAKTFPLEQFEAAFAMLTERQATGKVILSMD